MKTETMANELECIDIGERATQDDVDLLRTIARRLRLLQAEVEELRKLTAGIDEHTLQRAERARRALDADQEETR